MVVSKVEEEEVDQEVEKMKEKSGIDLLHVLPIMLLLLHHPLLPLPAPNTVNTVEIETTIKTIIIVRVIVMMMVMILIHEDIKIATLLLLRLIEIIEEEEEVEDLGTTTIILTDDLLRMLFQPKQTGCASL